MTSRKQIFEDAREALSQAIKERAAYEELDTERWAEARNPFEAWSDYSARTPARNVLRNAVKDAEKALRGLSSRRGYALVEEGEAA